MSKYNAEQATAIAAMDKGAFEAYKAMIEGTAHIWHNGEERIEVTIRKANRKTVVVATVEDGIEHKVRWTDLEPISPQNMAATLAKYRARYVTGLTASGRKSLHTGDDLAFLLEGKTGVEVCRIAERALGLEADELVAKYAKLNNGQQRMNAGNRIRAAIKRGDITIDDVKAAA